MRPQSFVADTFPVRDTDGACRGEDDGGWWTWQHPDDLPEDGIYTPGMAVPRRSDFLIALRCSEAQSGVQRKRLRREVAEASAREVWSAEEVLELKRWTDHRGNFRRLQAALRVPRTTLQHWLQRGKRPPVGTLQRIRAVIAAS